MNGLEAKLFEIRDRNTFIPVLAVRLLPGCEAERYLLARSGYGRTHEQQGTYVQLTRIAGGDGRSSCDAHGWSFDGTRTLAVAHAHITRHWCELPTGSVVDVEFILGEVSAPKVSERETGGLL